MTVHPPPAVSMLQYTYTIAKGRRMGIKKEMHKEAMEQ